MRPSSLALAPLVLMAVSAAFSTALGAGCSAGTGASRVPEAGEGVTWIDAPLAGPGLLEEADALRDALGGDDPQAALRALDRAVDLLDAARLGRDGDARDALWQVLVDPPGPRRGPEATRSAAMELLTRAWAIEALAADGISDDARAVLTDAIALLAVDVSPPGNAEDLSIRTLAQREIAERGHPRVADNARWRLYDHARASLRAATEAPAGRRIEIAMHVLYVERESIEGSLERLASGRGGAPLPPASALWDALEDQLSPLRSEARWAPLVASLEAGHGELREAFFTRYPVVRDPAWEVPGVEAGVGRRETLAPVLWARSLGASVDPGRGEPALLSLIDPQLGARLEAATAVDGRGALLLVAPPELPAPDFAAALEAVTAARVERVELAVREPEGGLFALPLQVLRPGAAGPGAAALRDARILLHLEGAGLRVAADGRWLPGHSADLPGVAERLELLRRAYPRERVATLTLGAGVQPRQLAGLLAALVGGGDPRFEAVGWSVAGGAPGPGEAAAEAIVSARGTLWAAEGTAPVIDQPHPLPGDDQARLEAFAGRLRACLPEIERAGASVEIELRFDHGRVIGHGARPRVPGTRRSERVDPEQLERCVSATYETFRLRQQRDPITLRISLKPPGRVGSG